MDRDSGRWGRYRTAAARPSTRSGAGRATIGSKFDPRPELDRPARQLWNRLVALEGPALGWAESFVYETMREASPRWRPGSEVRLHHREAVPVLTSYLAKAEGRMAALCSPHDYWTLFVLSRLCVGLPRLRRAEAGNMEVKTQRRNQGADLWALGCGTRGAASGAALSAEDTVGAALSSPSTKMLLDAVKLHALMDHYRIVVENLVILNVLRLHSGANEGEPGPVVTVDGMAGIRTVPNSSPRAQAAVHLFYHRFTHHRPFSAMGFGGLERRGDALRAMMMGYVEALPGEPFGGGLVFAPDLTELEELLGIGERFRTVFERDVGIPPEHLVTVLHALPDFCLEGRDDRAVKSWWYLTGCLPVPKDEVLGGALEAEAARVMREHFPDYGGAADLGESIERLVDRGLSKPPRSFSPVFGGSTEPDGFSARSIWPPYLIHGEPHHDHWLFDFVTTGAFLQRLVDGLRVTQTAHTTASMVHDAAARTAAFDLELAEYLEAECGTPSCFPELRPDENLPNVVFDLSSSGEDQEIDVPLKVGPVFVAVQTWAREADKRILEGDYEALRRRWNDARRKLRKTDEGYADRLLRDPKSSGFLRGRGVRHVLPLLCSPFAEPVVSDDPKYWLRPPSPVTSAEVDRSELGKATARVLTPPELAGFLSSATEAELTRICESNGWGL